MIVQERKHPSRQMTPEEQRSRHGLSLKITPTHPQQCLQVRFARACEPDDLRVDKLFSRKSSMAEQPPYCRLIPVAGIDLFFKFIEKPIVMKNVQKLMPEDRQLNHFI